MGSTGSTENGGPAFRKSTGTHPLPLIILKLALVGHEYVRRGDVPAKLGRLDGHGLGRDT